MSVTPFTYTRSRAYNEYVYSYRRQVDGKRCTGLDRSKPQPCYISEGQVLSWRLRKSDGQVVNSPTYPTGQSAHESAYLPFGGGFTPCVNKAYGSLVENLNGEQSAIGVAAGEWRQSLGMIANRTTGVYRAYRDLRKGDFRSALNHMSVSPKRKHTSKVKAGVSEVSGLWLEYSFGWKPMIQDVYSACRQMSEPLPSGERVTGRSKDRLDKIYSPAINSQRIVYEFSCEQGATFALVNPNLYLLSQLGLVNPATVAWERVPFSFLADWAFDVGSYLASFSDFVGLSMSDAYTTQVTRCDWSIYNSTGTTGVYRAKQVFMRRVLGLTRPLPNLNFRTNVGSSLRRAANGAALLGQIFSK